MRVKPGVVETAKQNAVGCRREVTVIDLLPGQVSRLRAAFAACFAT